MLPPWPRQGWYRDLPDPRDLLVDDESLADVWPAGKSRARTARPSAIDLTEYLPPPGAPHDVAHTAAAAIVTLVQYFERRATGQLLERAVEFVGHTARRLERGGGAASLRTVCQAIVRCGLPPAALWTAEHTARGPWHDALLFAYARDWAALRYVRLDAPDFAGAQVLRVVRGCLAAGYAVALGTVLPGTELTASGELPYPTKHDAANASTCLVVCGYDDQRRIRSTRGALRVRSMWGEAWGDAGQGWLPYRYVEQRLAGDCWTLVEPRWLASNEFARPTTLA